MLTENQEGVVILLAIGNLESIIIGLPCELLPQACWSSSVIEEFFRVDTTSSGAPRPKVQKGERLFIFSSGSRRLTHHCFDDLCRGRSIVPEETYIRK